MPAALDAIDQALLRQLTLDARRSNADLARQVGLSPSACLRRIRLLEHRGVIRGYTALTEGAQQDGGMSVIVSITLERQTADYLRRFEVAVARCPEVRECYLMTGGSDYFLRVEVENAEAFERVHAEVLSALPGVLRLHSSFAIRNVLRARLRRHPGRDGGR